MIAPSSSNQSHFDQCGGTRQDLARAKARATASFVFLFFEQLLLGSCNRKAGDVTAVEG